MTTPTTRARKACDPCRQLKRACEGAFPCSRCRARGEEERCVALDRRLRGPDQKPRKRRATESSSVSSSSGNETKTATTTGVTTTAPGLHSIQPTSFYPVFRVVANRVLDERGQFWGVGTAYLLDTFRPSMRAFIATMASRLPKPVIERLQRIDRQASVDCTDLDPSARPAEDDCLEDRMARVTLGASVVPTARTRVRGLRSRTVVNIASLRMLGADPAQIGCHETEMPYVSPMAVHPLDHAGRLEQLATCTDDCIANAPSNYCWTYRLARSSNPPKIVRVTEFGSVRRMDNGDKLIVSYIIPGAYHSADAAMSHVEQAVSNGVDLSAAIDMSLSSCMPLDIAMSPADLATWFNNGFCFPAWEEMIKAEFEQEHEQQQQQQEGRGRTGAIGDRLHACDTDSDVCQTEEWDELARRVWAQTQSHSQQSKQSSNCTAYRKRAAGEADESTDVDIDDRDGCSRTSQKTPSSRLDITDDFSSDGAGAGAGVGPADTPILDVDTGGSGAVADIQFDTAIGADGSGLGLYPTGGVSGVDVLGGTHAQAVLDKTTTAVIGSMETPSRQLATDLVSELAHGLADDLVNLQSPKDMSRFELDSTDSHSHLDRSPRGLVPYDEYEEGDDFVDYGTDKWFSWSNV